MAEYIEREKVLEAINGLRDKEEVFSVAEGALDKAFAAVEEIPAADVRPERHARWSDNMVSYMDDFNGG
ncbi:MAG: hypothetical protein K2N06_07805, partial [Oscillospiraceae bacterium]|nr:hypothetical protein [Oscillospiraceae bacterium]